MKLGVIYALPDKYATSIRIKNLTNDLGNIKTLDLIQKKWPENFVSKVYAIFRHTLRVLHPRFNPNILFASAPLIASSLPAVIFKKIRRKPLIIDWDDAFTDFSKTKPKFWQINYWEYKSVMLADAVIVVSKRLEKIAAKLRGSKENIFYIPNGVDTNLFNPKMHDRKKIRKKYRIKDSEFVIPFVGYIGKPKKEVGVFAGEPLIKIAKNLVKKHDVKFIVTGFGVGLELFKKKVKEVGLENNFIFTGYIPHKRIPEYISAADICVVLAVDVFASYARSSCKLKEFMSMGKPIIATNYGENVTDLGRGVGKLVPEDAKGVEKAVEMLLKNKAMRKKMGMNARKRAIAVYDFKKLRMRLLSAINKV